MIFAYFILPMPPSANGLFANFKGRGRIKSEQYTKWTHDAGWRLKSQKPGKIDGKYQLSIVVPAKTRGDIDNRIKAISDLLVEHGVVQDDTLAWSVSIRRDEAATEAHVTVESAS